MGIHYRDAAQWWWHARTEGHAGPWLITRQLRVSLHPLRRCFPSLGCWCSEDAWNWYLLLLAGGSSSSAARHARYAIVGIVYHSRHQQGFPDLPHRSKCNPTEMLTEGLFKRSVAVLSVAQSYLFSFALVGRTTTWCQAEFFIFHELEPPLRGQYVWRTGEPAQYRARRSIF